MINIANDNTPQSLLNLGKESLARYQTQGINSKINISIGVLYHA